jgi:hypothetical protein
MNTRPGFVHPATAAGCVVAALLAAGCASAPPRAERYIPPPVGATWSYQVTNTGSFGTASKVTLPLRMGEASFEGSTVARTESPTGATLQSRQTGGVIALVGPQGRTAMRYDPPLGYDWPLEVGKTWTQDLKLSVGSASPVPMKAQWKVEAYEDVTVPAGTFKAWRVSFTDNFGYKQTNWSVAEFGVVAKRVNERAASHPQGGAGTQVMELLTVPTVK